MKTFLFWLELSHAFIYAVAIIERKTVEMYKSFSEYTI
jgi:hypothetical protein